MSSSILVVDDEADSREVLTRALTQARYEVRSAPNGREALMPILSNPPDLVILDLFMPEMDGGGLLEILRSYLRLQSLPVIILTGLPDSPMVERARHLRVNAILVKAKATTDDILHAIMEELKRVPN
jgi:CheY-like chemotaxis protein